jgi:murein DD-endopeptidase MepM/ murein hydrolase activator NlpD
MPFGTCSHAPAPGNTTTGYSDAYDIANNSLPMVFAPFAGNLCFINCSDSGFGCYYTLTFEDGGESQKLYFAHFDQPNSQLSESGACMNVEEGFLINIMGNRGSSSDPHLHYEAAYGGQSYSPIPRNFSILETLVPETDQGSYPPVLHDTVTTCYE